MGLPVELVEEAEEFKNKAEGGVYPDNMTPVLIFTDMMTQWRSGASGIIGLDYVALPVVMDLHGIPAEDRKDIFDCIKVMEFAALSEIR